MRPSGPVGISSAPTLSAVMPGWPVSNSLLAPVLLTTKLEAPCATRSDFDRQRGIEIFVVAGDQRDLAHDAVLRRAES